MGDGLVSRQDDRVMPEAERPDAAASSSFCSDMLKAVGKKCGGFFGHSSVNKQSIVKNAPAQPSQLGKDGFYTNVSNRAGKL